MMIIMMLTCLSHVECILNGEKLVLSICFSVSQFFSLPGEKILNPAHLLGLNISACSKKHGNLKK